MISPDDVDKPLDQSMRALRTPYFSVENTRRMRIDDYEWEHEVRVALPASYADSTKAYPVLWVTDNKLELAISILGKVDLILVGVGPRHSSATEFDIRRCYDFYAMQDFFPMGPGGEYLRRELPISFPGLHLGGGGASRFLDFLVDEVRPILAAEYRMDEVDHGIIGHSAGGTFVAYAMFARPGAFTSYICGSPALYSGNSWLFELEKQYATEHDDLSARVFFGAGEAEIAEPFVSAHGCVSSMIKMAETLGLRSYPSLRLTTRIFPGETHATILPLVLSWGVRSVWGSQIATDSSGLVK